MTSTSIHLLVTIIALSIVCMDLTLAIVYSWFKKVPWTKIYIVFVASLLGCIGMQMLVYWSDISFNGLTSFVLMTIWRSILVADGAFLLTFIPYFTTWIIAHPWRNPYKSIFFSCSAIYLVVGIISIVQPYNMMIDVIEFILGGFVLFFCLFVLLKNYKGIENRWVRLISRTIIIAGLIMIPISLFGIFFKIVRESLSSIIYLCFGIIMLVFLFIANRKHFVEMKSEPEKPSIDDFFEHYHITDREAEIIKLIKQGKTAKEIAADLDISVNTVNNHIANIYSKTEVRSRIDLLNLFQEGW